MEGQASGFNAGFAASRGEWFLFLDSDDYAVKSWRSIHKHMRLSTTNLTAAFSECMRVLCPGGSFSFVVPQMPS